MIKRQTVLIGRRAFGTTPAAGGKSSSTPAEEPKTPLQRLREFFEFRPGAPSWAQYAEKNEKVHRAFRSPSPASQRPANVPTVEDEEYKYNTQYYTRDTARNQPLAQMISPEPPKEFPLEPPAELGSKGRKNPAVERYDPTGTRSAMTTSWKALNDEIAKRQPDHLPHAWWQRDPKLLDEATDKAKKNEMPLPIGVSRKSLGVPRYGKNVW